MTKYWILGIAVTIGLLLLGPAAFFFLWNWVLPSLGLPHITFWQALGIFIMAKLLFPPINIKGAKDE